MASTETTTRGAPSGAGGDDELPAGDRALLDLAVASLVAQNAGHAARLEAVARFHANRVAEAAARRDAPTGFFTLTPLQATKAEVAPLLAVSEIAVATDVDLVEAMHRWFPRLWARCLTGRLDVARARLAYAQLENLTSDADKDAYAALVEEWLERADDPTEALCRISWRRFTTAVRRRCLKFPQRNDHDTFAAAFAKRRVSLRTDDNGMAWVSAAGTVPEAVAADYRLTLIAKKLREAPGETRTLDQLRADALFDLIHGRISVAATTGELEDDMTSDGADPATSITRTATVGGYARPVINVTVPVTTLMGLTDTPGVMAGDTSLPADLVRALALHPDATWHRLLTDPAGGFLELSTTSYTPSEPIARWTIARDRICVWPGCSRPATVCELDHRIAYPAGATCTCNLQPLCRHHHQVKHSDGFDVVRNSDGSYSWSTRHGSVFQTPPPDYPVGTWCQPSADADVGSVIEREFRTWLERSGAG